MNRALNVAKLDFLSAVSSLARMPIIFIIAVVVGLTSKQPYSTLAIIMIFGVFMGGTMFAVHEKSRSEKLYGILPLSKREVIAGHYLFALFNGIANIIIDIVVVWVLALYLKYPLEPLLFLGGLSAVFIYYCFATGVTYPIYVKLGFAKAYVFTMIPMVLIMIAILLLARRTDVVSNIMPALSFLSANIWLVPVIGAVIGLALLAVSAVVANAFYAKKEL